MPGVSKVDTKQLGEDGGETIKKSRKMTEKKKGTSQAQTMIHPSNPSTH